MNKNILLIFIALLLTYTGVIVIKKDKLLKSDNNPDYQKYIQEYRNTIDKSVMQLIDKNEELGTYNLDYKGGQASGTTGNFEGPQVHLQAIKFHNEVLVSEDERLKHIDAVSAHFDPDHPCYGLPDVKISIQDVRLYEQPESNISKFLSRSKKEPEPYKVYRKRIKTDSLGLSSKYFVMQLWLTEFKVTIDIRPDKDCFVKITEEEKDSTYYPGFWYGSTQPKIKLKDLKREFKDNRYSNLSFILKVLPDNSPIYYQSTNEKTEKADFALAAIYCSDAKIGNEPDVQRISTNVHTGQPIFLIQENQFDLLNSNIKGFSENIEANTDEIFRLKTLEKNYIWNKPYYFKLFFNNLGTWRSGLFNQNEFHDQVTYKFLMPVFVVGSWDVIAPQEILPTWSPPEPYIRKVTLSSFLPFGNMGFLGKMFSVIILLGILVIGLWLISPNFLPLIKRIFGK